MKYIKKFNEQENSIEEWCEKLFDSDEYIINSDNTIDVNDNVNLQFKGLERIPFYFGIVTGHFDCADNELISLRGCPREVGADFRCEYNKLESLKESPIKVRYGFSCQNNFLTTLNGSPEKVGYNFICSFNRLRSLEGCPEEIGGIFSCVYNPIYEVFGLFGSLEMYKASLDYNYWRNGKINEGRFKMACKDAGFDAPESIKGYEYID
jgi:hypothetical protein